jgi:hypothetical protein
MYRDFHEKNLADQRKKLNEALSVQALQSSGSAHSFHEPLTNHGFTHMKTHQTDLKGGNYMMHHDYSHPKGHHATVTVYGERGSTEPYHIATVAHDKDIKGQTHKVITAHTDVNSLHDHLKGLSEK